MVAYVIAQVRVSDPATYDEYKKKSGPAVAAFGGRFLVRGGPMEVIEGESDAERVVIVEFPDRETAKAWYDSELYREARAIRAPVSEAVFTLVSSD